MEQFTSWPSNWLKLDRIIAKIVDAINFRTPYPGKGVLITELPSGVIISIDAEMIAAIAQRARVGAAGGDISKGDWIPVDVMDANCNRSTIWVWGSTNKPSV